MGQNFTKGFDVVKLLTETCMEKIFGRRWDVCECIEDDWNMVQVYNELVSMFNKLSIESPIWITMLVRSLGGKIKFDKPYLFRGRTNIYGLEYDNDCGLTFACCADGDDDFYIEDEFTWTEAQEFIQFLSGRGDDVNKLPYVNSIFLILNSHQASRCFDFYTDERSEITYCGVKYGIKRVSLQNDDFGKTKVSISYYVDDKENSVIDWLFNLDLDLIKSIYDLFTRQIFKADENNQIIINN